MSADTNNPNNQNSIENIALGVAAGVAISAALTSRKVSKAEERVVNAFHEKLLTSTTYSTTFESTTTKLTEYDTENASNIQRAIYNGLTKCHEEHKDDSVFEKWVQRTEKKCYKNVIKQQEIAHNSLEENPQQISSQPEESPDTKTLQQLAIEQALRGFKPTSFDTILERAQSERNRKETNNPSGRCIIM